MQNRLSDEMFVRSPQPLSREGRPGQKTKPEDVPTEQAISKFGELIKMAPATSLAIALVAGMALGFWVKRS